MSAVATPDSIDFLRQLQSGQKLAGCYLLQKQIAHTGGRIVWLAHDEVLGKDVALHFLPRKILSREGVAERLRQEVKRNRQLIHPNILRVYDFIEEDEWAAISMDAFDGGTLSSRLAEREGGAFDVAEIAPWIESLCNTLEDAHRIRLVHGALTPDDVVVGDGGKVRVMNFGIGAALRDADESAANDAQAFASPQQLDGQKPVPTDDVFAVGALTHTLLAGEPPFAGRQRGAARTVAEHRRARKRKGPDVPAGWQGAISAALAVDPAARPAAAADFLKQTTETTAAAPVMVKAATTEAKPPVIEAKVETPVPTSEPKRIVEEKHAPVPESRAKREPERKPSEAVEKNEVVERKKAAEEKEPSAAAAPVDAEALAETVRREEAVEEARTFSYGTDDDGEYVGRPRGGRGLALPVIGAAVGLLILFAVVKMLVGGPSRQPLSRSTGESATPEPAPVVAKTTTETAKPPSVDEFKPIVPEPARSTESAAIPTPVVESTPPPPPPEPAKEPVVEKSPVVIATEEAEAGAKRQQELESNIAAAKKELDEKSKSLPIMQKAVSEIAVQEKKREDEAMKAEQAARLAEQIAAEKKRLAEVARAASTAFVEESKTKKEEHTKTVELVATLQKTMQEDEKTLVEVRKAAAEAAKRRDDEAKKVNAADAAKAAQLAAEKANGEKKQKEMADAERKASEAADARAREEAVAKARDAEKPKVLDSLAEARKEFERQAAKLEEAIKAKPPEKPAATPAPASPGENTLRNEKPPIAGEETGLLAANKTAAKEMELPRTTELAPDKSKAGGAKGEFMNSLGMKFVPLGETDLLIAIWPTRVRDFEVFAKAAGLKSTLWKDPGFKQGSDHPVVNVTWQEAAAFCKWLSAKERAEGLLAPNQTYRLPTDLEWSRAVGLSAETGTTPESRDMSVPDVYPWGTAWPPPAGAGNYTGEETGSDVAIKGYDDGFPWTSPVGSFPANKQGIYDMGGNVWQWCQDSWNNESKAKVLRGASWYNGALKLSLLSSCRVHAAPDSGTDNYGFRVVIAEDSGKTQRR